MEDRGDQARDFAAELVTYIRDYFEFCLVTDSPGYLVQYAAATFLSPLHQFVLSPAEITMAKEFLSSKMKMNLLS